MTDGGMTGYTAETAVSKHTDLSGHHDSDTHKPEEVYGTQTNKDTHISEDTQSLGCVQQTADTQADSASDHRGRNTVEDSSMQNEDDSYEILTRPDIYPADPGSVTFDCKYYRLRIFKSVIRMLGNPPYIILLMDSASHEIAIMGQQEEIDDCLRVPENLMNDPAASFTLHARWYIQSVMSLMKWGKRSYRVPCVSIINETIPVFGLDQAAMLNGTEEEL